MAKKICACILLSSFLVVGLSGCGSNDKYADTVKSGVSKYYSGESMTKEEYQAAKGYLDWKEKNSSQTYSQWDN